MNATPIQLEHVSRAFDGTAVIKDLSIAVPSGSIYGFLGRNGSGKTTTLRMLAGLIRPDTGVARISGQDPFDFGAEARQQLGYMSEKAAASPFAKVRTVLNLGRDLYPRWDSSLASSLVTKYGISPKKRLSALSQGGQRLLAFIMAVAPRPNVLLLDEPAANLDVVARREILDEILTLIRDFGCTVLFSTHILSDVERVADQVGILANGSLRVSEPLDSLKESIQQVRFFGFPSNLPAEEVPGSFRTTRTRNELTVTMRVTETTNPASLAERWSCQQETRPLNLEDIFVELSRN
jgi:ABC-2 type transport system ATP-binding protein